ncbi:hypothetical protein BN12_720010 [Nostocoides japonicum T1-X7]|uniref:Uncharacterized protein n=1 Tax=Nostocoides japonicum T1-X7 TaxID=1194083 RepID=A0A077M4R7_9MICO|nr:hypothetical protein BN12_720010 [Tetrasphaera japonica T1-X7]
MEFEQAPRAVVAARPRTATLTRLRVRIKVFLRRVFGDRRSGPGPRRQDVPTAGRTAPVRGRLEGTFTHRRRGVKHFGKGVTIGLPTVTSRQVGGRDRQVPGRFP